MSPNQHRHQILLDHWEMLQESGLSVKDPIDINKLINYKPNPDARVKAWNYLLAGKFFEHTKINDKSAALITQLGLDAINSEYFLEKDKEEFRKKKNNTIIGISTIIVAAGVIYSLFQPNSNKQEIKIQIQNPQQVTPLLDTTVILNRKDDSANLIYRVSPDKKIK